jgi:outer membrane receptor protein involved in Fe transport
MFLLGLSLFLLLSACGFFELELLPKSNLRKMKTLSQLFLLTSLILMIIPGATAQTSPVEKTPFTVSGIIIDIKSKQPVPYAAVALLEGDSKLNVAGAVADFNGKFTITGFKSGTYLIQISFVGYQAFSSESFELSEDKSQKDFGQVAMEEEAVRLEEVIVMGQRDLIEEKVDRTIYNAQNDKTLVGGDATDVLRRVPMLSVDLDGNVSMRGSSRILVLINGKQSALVANNIADAMKQIPAEEIKSVEVITSPSAKYDAEGTGGVINIITKKNNLQGGSLNLNSSVGLRGTNLGLNGSLKKGKMGFSLGGFGRAGYNISGFFENEQLVTNADGSKLTILQNAETRNNMMFGRYNFGWDYDINKFNFMTASVSFGLRNMQNRQDGLLTRIFQNQDMTGASAVLRDVNVSNLNNNVDVNFNYTKTFEKPVKEFSISGLYSQSNLTNDFINSIYNGTFDGVARRIKNNNEGINREYTVQLDYVTPVGAGNSHILEYGAKNILRKAVSNFAYFTAEGADGPFVKNPDLALSNEFSYDQNVTAGYASYTTSFLKNYSAKAGVRYEYTAIEADFRNSELPADIPAYGVWVPSLNLSRKLGQGKMIKAAYNRRVQRPSLNFLNPNINAANPQQISQGNPFLDPELTDNYELSYSTFVKGSSLNFTTFIRNTTGSIQPVRTVQDNDVIFTTFENIGQETAYGLSIFSNINLSGKFSLNGSVDTYFAVLTNGNENPLYAASNQGFVVSGRLFGNYTLPRDWQIQAFTFMRGRQVELQGTSGGFGVYGLNLNKQFNERKGSIGFGAENFFTKVFVINNELVTPSIMQQSTVGMRNMNFKVNFTYRIGKISMEGARRKKRGVTNEDLKEGSDSNAGIINN